MKKDNDDDENNDDDRRRRMVSFEEAIADQGGSVDPFTRLKGRISLRRAAAKAAAEATKRRRGEREKLNE